MIDDPGSANHLTLVFPELANKWTELRQKFWDAYHLQLKVTQGLRTYEEQWEIYAQGRKKDENGEWYVCDKSKVVTYAKGGESYHNFGLALDSAFMGSDPFLEKLPKAEQATLWEDYGLLVEKVGLGWGGRFKNPDRPHCEMTFGLPVTKLQAMFKEGGNKLIWEQCSRKEIA